MRLFGEWWTCDDGVVRPTIETLVSGAGGQSFAERFLIDCGADQTVLSAGLLAKLQLPTVPAGPGYALAGVSGTVQVVGVSTVLEFARCDGGPARVRGQFAAFTNPTATDLSILGRDVLNAFDVILSYPRQEILLLTGNHHYAVQ